MPWETTAPALQALLAAIPEAGQVHLGDRFRDGAAAKAAMTSPVEGARDRLRACVISRISVSEQWHTSDRTKARERYLATWMQGVTELHDSEVAFQNFMDTVWAKIRSVDTVADALLMDAGKTAQIGFLEMPMGDHMAKVHIAAVALDFEEWYSIDSTTTPPVVDATQAGTRATFEDGAHSIVSVLSGIDGIGIVHAGRPWIFDDTDFRQMFMVATGEDDGRETVRAWKVYRLSDAEERGLAGMVTAKTIWKLSPAYLIYDAGDSYQPFQVALDTVRAKVRSHGCFGSRWNPTLTTSGPLQITEIGARSISGRPCHWADCSIAVEEHVYA